MQPHARHHDCVWEAVLHVVPTPGFLCTASICCAQKIIKILTVEAQHDMLLDVSGVVCFVSRQLSSFINGHEVGHSGAGLTI